MRRSVGLTLAAAMLMVSGAAVGARSSVSATAKLTRLAGTKLGVTITNTGSVPITAFGLALRTGYRIEQAAVGGKVCSETDNAFYCSLPIAAGGTVNGTIATDRRYPPQAGGKLFLQSASGPATASVTGPASSSTPPAGAETELVISWSCDACGQGPLGEAQGLEFTGKLELIGLLVRTTLAAKWNPAPRATYGAIQVTEAPLPKAGTRKHELKIAGLLLYPKGTSPPKTNTVRLDVSAANATALRKSGPIAVKPFPNLTKADLQHAMQFHFCDIFRTHTGESILLVLTRLKARPSWSGSHDVFLICSRGEFAFVDQ